MNSAKKIADYLLNNDNYHIIVHKNPDGDCLGSSKALCLALQSIGKKAKIILPNPPSSRLRFFWDEELELGDFPCDNVISVDVASYGQMGDLYDVIFKNAPYSICIDHHGTNEGYAKLNYVDFTSSSTGELIFEIIELMDIDITEKIAKSLLISIADDTGCFQYSNTSARTHLTAAKLYEIIPDPEPTMRALYNTHSLGEIEALKHIMPSLEYHLGGRVWSAARPGYS